MWSVSRRSIMWDLQRNGGNVVATTERILSGRGLENPPQSFQPPPPAQTPTSSTPTPAAKPAQPDLITRYNLKAKLAAQEAEAQAQAQAAAVESETKPKQGGQSWSTNKGERQALLQKRREEMILAARRKMEERVKAEKAMSG
ncbi:hypothetical protein CJF31_00008948 [Rutstroemia sp. NJR-2017a BVV2]|nr:hypothetical protein CJF31_00008948 [Rutstroemia sp. NJR-2017a BVV2]